MRYAIDAAKIEQEIGWVPRRRFEEGLRETVGWYLENAAWVENIQSGNIANGSKRIIAGGRLYEAAGGSRKPARKMGGFKKYGN